MKTELLHMLLAGCLTLVGCKTIQNPWYWLDEPGGITWVPMTIQAYGRSIEFSVPDSAPSFGEKVIRSSDLKDDTEDGRFVVPLKYLDRPSVKIVGFGWEYYWGGFMAEDTVDFTMLIYLTRAEGNPGLLDFTVDERMERIKSQYYNYFEDDDYGRWKKSIFEIEPYESSQGYVWTLERTPPIHRVSEDFKLPITDQHELNIDFYYRMNELNPVHDEAWLKRRKRIARQILDSFRITPEPSFPNLQVDSIAGRPFLPFAAIFFSGCAHFD